MPSFMNFKVTLKRNNLLISILGIKKREQKINMWSSYNTQNIEDMFYFSRTEKQRFPNYNFSCCNNHGAAKKRYYQSYMTVLISIL